MDSRVPIGLEGCLHSPKRFLPLQSNIGIIITFVFFEVALAAGHAQKACPRERSQPDVLEWSSLCDDDEDDDEMMMMIIIIIALILRLLFLLQVSSSSSLLDGMPAEVCCLVKSCDEDGDAPWIDLKAGGWQFRDTELCETGALCHDGLVVDHRPMTLG